MILRFKLLYIVFSCLCVWLQCFVAHSVQDHDEPILKHLTDIKVTYPDETGMVRETNIVKFIK